MKIAITGASGFIGKSLCEALLSEGHEISVLTRKSQFPIAPVNIFRYDLLSDKNNLKKFVDGIDVIYHCAGEIKNEALMCQLHIDGTKRLLTAVRESIKNNKKQIRWVQLSSVGAYGPPPVPVHAPRVITEMSPCLPISKYEVTKTSADALVVEFSKRNPFFSYTILRPSNVIGPTMKNQSLAGMVQMIEKGMFFYIGSKNSMANYIHVDDVISALLHCGVEARARGEIFNLSNDCLLSEVVNAVAKAKGVSSPNLCVPEPILRFAVKCLSPVINLPLTKNRIDALVGKTYYPFEKIYKTIGFAPRNSIPEIIPSMFQK